MTVSKTRFSILTQYLTRQLRIKPGFQNPDFQFPVSDPKLIFHFSGFQISNSKMAIFWFTKLRPDNWTTLPYLLLNEVASPLFCLHRVVNQLSAKAED